jgi:hypothetical protein
LARTLVRYFQLDHQFQPLRFRDEWFYLLRGESTPGSRRPDIVYLSTVVTQGNDTYLYRGIITAYYYDRSGNLDRVVLWNAMRRPLSEDRPSGVEHMAGGDERFYSVVGDRFVLKYSEMQTINIEGVSLEGVSLPEEPQAKAAVPTGESAS